MESPRPGERTNQQTKTMNTKNITKTVLLAATCALWGSVAALAADDPAVVSVAVDQDPVPRGALGQNTAALGFSYIDADDSGIDANAINLTLNQGLRTGLDTLLEYNYLRSENTGFGDIVEHKFNFGGRAYTNFHGFRPFVDGGIGWTWLKAPLGLSDNSFLWFASIGAEFQATADLTITPMIRFWDATSYTDGDTWEYGVKANYWVNEKLGVTAKVIRADSESTEYGLGINYRF